MSRTLFGTDGVRGLAGEYPLDTDGANRIGRAVGMYFAEAGQTIIIGYDPRESSQQIVQDAAAGLNAVGVNVVSAGVIATPGLAYLTREHQEFVAGIMVTASHNPYQYNGIKVFAANGGKLNDEIEMQLNQLIESDLADRGQGEFIVRPDLLKQYETFLLASAGTVKLQGLRLAVDAANGATSGYAASVLEQLGAEVTPLFTAPDGKNINDHCGATDVAVLQQVVKDKKLDMGVALDGDADRLIMVDDQGREVKGDYLMYILAVAHGYEGVIATVMSNLGFENALRAKGIDLQRTAVGDRYVLEALEKTGWHIGGEQSGHIILPDILQTGDGLLAAIRTICAVRESTKNLAAWCDEVVLLPQALVNFQIADKSLLARPDIQQFIQEQTTSLGTQGRLLIRPSGTEPLARVMVEAPDAQERADSIAHELESMIQRGAA